MQWSDIVRVTKMSFVSANDHPNPHSPDDPLYYAPRSVRSIADPRSNATPQTRSDYISFPLLLCLGLMKCARKPSPNSPLPIASQFVYERREPRILLATAGGIAAAIESHRDRGARLFLTCFQGQKAPPRNSPSLISTPASATPARVTSEEFPRAASKIQAVSKDARKRKPGTYLLPL